MGEEGRLLFIERGDCFHVLVGKGEVEHVEVFCHSFFVRRFGDDDNAALQMPAKNDLRRCLTVFCAYLLKDGVGEQSAPAFAEGRPRFMDDAVFLHPFVRGFLLIVRVRLHLIDHWLDTREGAKVYQPVRVEVGNADGAQFSLCIQLFQSSPCAVVIGKRLVQKHKVDVIELQLTQRFQHGLSAFFIAVVFDPYFCGDEQLFAGNARPFDRVADFLFVEVGLRRVDMAVADRKGVGNTPFTFLPRHLIHAVAELGHFYTVRKRYIFHNKSLLLIFAYIMAHSASKGNSK